MHTIKQPEAIAEGELIRRITDGERELFELLVRRNNPFLYRVGISYGFSRQDTEDLVQDTFIAAFVHLSKFQQRSSLKTWLIKIMLNLCYKRSHTLSFRNEKPVNDGCMGKVLPMFADYQNKDVHRCAENKELTRVIETALSGIPTEYRMVFSLRELNGMSTMETAEALDITETNVKIRLYRARHMLREVIEKKYSPEDIFEFNLIYCNRITTSVMQAISN